MLRGADLERLLESGGGAEDVLEEVQVSPEAEVGTRPQPKNEEEKEAAIVLCDGGVRNVMLQRSSARGSRLGDGQNIGFRLAKGEPLTEAELGGSSLPWALEVTARRINIGDAVEVVAKGEYALADDEELEGDVAQLERTWRFELATASGEMRDKFRMTVDERIEQASKLRERGNAMLKKGRLLRAGDYYQRGSSLMDVIEAEDMGGMPGMQGMPGGKKDERAVANNTRIRDCQKPILLNWALVLIRRSLWQEAEQKCTEVLLDIDASCVKALFRRGQCRVQLGSLEEARKDLLKARDIDESVASDVDRELAKLQRQQKVLDRQDRSWAKKALQKGLGDDRSQVQSASKDNDGDEGIECNVKENSKARVMPSSTGSSPPGGDLIATLAEQQQAAEKDGVDDITYCRQREAIYNQFMRGPRPETDS